MTKLVSAALTVERAAGDFRRGAPVLIRGAGSEILMAAAVETLTQETLSALAAEFTLSLLLTHDRAQTLKIRLYTPDVVAIPLSASMRLSDLRAAADPTADLDYPMKGPFDAQREALPASASEAVALAKLAGLLPAVVFSPADAKVGAVSQMDLSSVTSAAIADFAEDSARKLVVVTRAHVPLEGAEDAELVAFRPADGGPEHYAVIIGAPHDPALVRLHSECFTGDFLGSLKCDCGDQLRGAIAAIAKAGGGALLYLAQEGRGIGLMNKLRAYRLQDEGFDTLEANRRLGFAEDERQYDIAARMLHLLGFKKVRLMTNNPSKVAALEKSGIMVAERVPHSFPDNAHNRDYLRTKSDKGGHLF